jgi:hypothetical protein
MRGTFYRGEVKRELILIMMVRRHGTLLFGWPRWTQILRNTVILEKLVVAQIVKMLATVYGGQRSNRAPQHNTSGHYPQLDRSSPHFIPIPCVSFADVSQAVCCFQRQENTLYDFRNCATLGRVLWPERVWIHSHANFWISWLHKDKLGKRVHKEEKITRVLVCV